MIERCLITGGAGFIGHHTLEHFLIHTDWEIVILDKLTYAGDLNRIVDAGMDLERIKYVYHDIRAPLNGRVINEIGAVDYIIHAAAETHVDRSLEDAEPFVYSNFIGTFNMLEYARSLREKLKRYIQISTDEVYGPAHENVRWKEWDRLSPSNPYAATKAGADCLVLAYQKCHKLKAIVTRTMNNFGERQHPEKFVPLIIRSILNGKTIDVHGERLEDGSWHAGTRIWLHARNHADAVLFLLQRDYEDLTESDSIINVAGNIEVSNKDMVMLIGEILDKKPKWKWFDFHSSRPGHDLRYALDGSRIHSMGWVPPVPFRESLEKAVLWTANNPKYLEWA